MANLAARCTACGTVFRVVPDQLRVAGGLVRCGRCAQVFNANDSLIDLDAMAPAPTQPVPAVPAIPAAPPTPEPQPVQFEDPTQDPLAEPVSAVGPESDFEATPESEPTQTPDPGSVDLSAAADAAEAREFVDAPTAPAAEPGTYFELVLPPDSQPARLAPSAGLESALPEPQSVEVAALQPWSGGELRFDAPTTAEPEPEPIQAAAGWPADEREGRIEPFLDNAPPKDDPLVAQPSAGTAFELDLPTAEPAAAESPVPAESSADLADSVAAEPAPDVQPDAVPSFVRQAESAERWRSPKARAWMGAGVAAGVLLLAGQYTFTFLDTLVAKQPGLRPLLEPPCVAFGCRIEAPRLIDQLAVESSGLVRVEKSAVYKLQLALRNRDRIAVAMPALDVTLSDAQGKPLARRVLRMSELGVTDTTLAAGRELAVQATLQAAFQPPTAVVAGYTIELFYP